MSFQREPPKDSVCGQGQPRKVRSVPSYTGPNHRCLGTPGRQYLVLVRNDNLCQEDKEKLTADPCSVPNRSQEKTRRKEATTQREALDDRRYRSSWRMRSRNLRTFSHAASASPRWRTDRDRKGGMRAQPRGRPRSRRGLLRWIRARSRRLTRQYWRKAIREGVCLGISSRWCAKKEGSSSHEDEKCLAQSAWRSSIVVPFWGGRPQPVQHRVCASQRGHILVDVLRVHDVRCVVVA